MPPAGAIARGAAALVAAALASSVSHANSSRSPAHYEASRISMACEYAIEAYGPDADGLPAIVDEAFDEVDRIDRLIASQHDLHLRLLRAANTHRMPSGGEDRSKFRRLLRQTHSIDAHE